MTYSYTIEGCDYDEDGIIYSVICMEHHISGAVFRDEIASCDTRQEAENFIKGMHEEWAKAYASAS